MHARGRGGERYFYARGARTSPRMATKSWVSGIRFSHTHALIVERGRKKHI